MMLILLLLLSSAWAEALSITDGDVSIGQSGIPIMSIVGSGSSSGINIDVISITKLEETQTQAIMTGIASFYDYSLEGYGERSKSHNTCAVRILPKYNTWKVCNKDNGKCVECYQNDYGPKEYTHRIIDLSSHAFAQIGSLKKGLMEVDIYLLQ